MLVSESLKVMLIMESFNQEQDQSTNSIHEPHEVYMRLALELVGWFQRVWGSSADEERRQSKLSSPTRRQWDACLSIKIKSLVKA